MKSSQAACICKKFRPNHLQSAKRLKTGIETECLTFVAFIGWDLTLHLWCVLCCLKATWKRWCTSCAVVINTFWIALFYFLATGKFNAITFTNIWRLIVSVIKNTIISTGISSNCIVFPTKDLRYIYFLTVRNLSG